MMRGSVEGEERGDDQCEGRIMRGSVQGENDERINARPLRGEC
jgi:hypothetical protein